MLELAAIRKTFHPGTVNEVRALAGVDLVVAPGDFVVVIGTNGSGKSTLQNVVAGVFSPAERDVTDWTEHRRAALIGRVFQNPFSGTAPTLTIEENLALAAKRGLRRGLGRSLSRPIREAIRDRVRTLGIGIEDRLASPISTLSGGQRQAVTLLMATWRRPALLLLDEHTAALDPKSAETVLRLTKTIVDADSLTTLMVTHSMQQAANFGNRLIMMHKGRVVYDVSGREKARLQPQDLLDRFEAIRREERLDESVAEMLHRNY
jgi:putative ABC transport system ATP-binding protein